MLIVCSMSYCYGSGGLCFALTMRAWLHFLTVDTRDVPRPELEDGAEYDDQIFKRCEPPQPYHNDGIF